VQVTKHLARRTSTPSGSETRCFTRPENINATISHNNKSDLKRTLSQDRRVTTSEHNKALMAQAKKDIAAINEKAV
jgi:hypothetical protein